MRINKSAKEAAQAAVGEVFDHVERLQKAELPVDGIEVSSISVRLQRPTRDSDAAAIAFANLKVRVSAGKTFVP